MVAVAVLAGLFGATIFGAGPLIARRCPNPSSPAAAAAIATWAAVALAALSTVT